jgi:8-oxo-dGTP diphosphatase
MLRPSLESQRSSRTRPPVSDPLRVVAAAWRRRDQILACRRSESAARAGLWELPGGKVEPGEGDREALARELQEELSAVVEVGAKVGENVHEYSELTIRLIAYWCTGPVEPIALEHQEVRWVDSEEAETLNWAAADRPLIQCVLRLLRAGELPQT